MSLRDKLPKGPIRKKLSDTQGGSYDVLVMLKNAHEATEPGVSENQIREHLIDWVDMEYNLYVSWVRIHRHHNRVIIGLEKLITKEGRATYPLTLRALKGLEEEIPKRVGGEIEEIQIDFGYRA